MSSVSDFRNHTNILTIGAIAGIFTWGLIMTFKNAVLVPLFNAFIVKKAGVTNLPNNQYINWGNLIVDFLIWLLVLFILYLVWRQHK